MVTKKDQYSPNKRYKLTFYGFEEPKMGLSICRFQFTDIETKEIVDFQPLWAIGIGESMFSWSENENFFSLPLINLPKRNAITENFFIYNINKKKFASVHFSNCWSLTACCHDLFLEVEYTGSYESENLKYPTKEFTLPDKMNFCYTDLQWTPNSHLYKFNELNANAVIHSLKPVDKGWRKFRGQLPQTTDIRIWELKRFAEYGDIQSRKWLAELEATTGGLNNWLKASYYIGSKNRE